MTDAHLDGRFALLELELKELGDRYPTITALLEAEMSMISDEKAKRAAGKSKPSPVVPEWEPEFEGWDPDSLALTAETVQLEDECEI